MAENKVKCKYCGKMIAKSGIKNHEEACAKKYSAKDKGEVKEAPEVVEEAMQEEEVAPAKEVKDEVETIELHKEQKPKEKLETIKMKSSINCNIAGKRYTLASGKTYHVPANVKDILMEAGMLAAL